MNIMTRAILRKEFIHIFKEPQTLFIIVVMPLLMLLLYGTAITLEMKSIPTVISDGSRSVLSRTVVDAIGSSKFFRIVATQVPVSEADRWFQSRRAACVVVIPPDFSDTLERDRQSVIQVIIDAADPTVANYVQNYLSQILLRLNTQMNSTSATALIRLEPRYLYNPELKSAYFFVPGLAAVILLLVSTLLTTIAIVKEKEQGTMDQLLVSPIQPLQIIAGKIIPYLILAFLEGCLILAVSVFGFGVPLHGSLLLLLAALVLYIACGLSLGLLISAAGETQEISMMMALLLTILPAMLLSGFIFPIESMPVIFQWISRIIPATHFIQIIRGVMLKGVGITELASPFIALVTITVVLNVASVKRLERNFKL